MAGHGPQEGGGPRPLCPIALGGRAPEAEQAPQAEVTTQLPARGTELWSAQGHRLGHGGGWSRGRPVRPRHPGPTRGARASPRACACARDTRVADVCHRQRAKGHAPNGGERRPRCAPSVTSGGRGGLAGHVLTPPSARGSSNSVPHPTVPRPGGTTSPASASPLRTPVGRRCACPSGGRRRCGSSGTRGRHSMTCSGAGARGLQPGPLREPMQVCGDGGEQPARSLHERVHLEAGPASCTPGLKLARNPPVSPGAVHRRARGLGPPAAGQGWGGAHCPWWEGRPPSSAAPEGWRPQSPQASAHQSWPHGNRSTSASGRIRRAQGQP